MEASTPDPQATERHPSRRRWLALVAVAALALVAAVVLLAGRIGDDSPASGGVEGAAVVWAVGDGADGGEQARQVADLIGEEGLDRFLYLGDVYETGSAEEFETNYASVYGRFTDITEPTPGNHEWPSHEEGYDPHWAEVKGRPQPPYYSFELAGWQVLSLNSQEGYEPGSPQVDWLREQVSAPGTCRLAFFHRPRYAAGTGEHGDQANIEPFWSALEDRAALVVNAHDHNMQRFAPFRGITELIAGAGGHGLYDIPDDDDRPAFTNDTDYGALRLELEPGVARFRFVAADGRTLDEGSVPCEEG